MLSDVLKLVNGKVLLIIEIKKSDIVSCDYYCQKFPIDNLCLGTDFFGTDFLPDGIHENYASLEILREELEKRGYKEKDVEKIFYKNLSDFLN